MLFCWWRKLVSNLWFCLVRMDLGWNCMFLIFRVLWCIFMILLSDLLVCWVQVVIFRYFGRFFCFIISEWQCVIVRGLVRLVNMLRFLWWIGLVLLCIICCVCIILLLKVWLMFWWLRQILSNGSLLVKCLIMVSEMLVLLGVQGLGERMMCLGVRVLICFMFSLLLCIILILVLSLLKYCIRLQVKELQLLIISSMLVVIF